MNGKKVWTRLQAFLLAVILVATNVVIPSAAGADARAGVSTPRPKLYVDFLGDNSNRPGIAADPKTAVAPTNDAWKYTQPSDAGTIFWVGVGIENAEDLKLGTDGSLYSVELGFYYDPAYVEPYLGAGGTTDANFRSELEKVNLSTNPNDHQWSSSDYEFTSAVAQADPADPQVGATIYDHATQERDEAGRVYTIPPNWKMAHVALEKKAGATGANRIPAAGAGNDRGYVMMIPFVLKGVPADNTTPRCFRLARNASVFTFGGGTDGQDAYAAWERDTGSHPDENLKLKLEFTGDLNIFAGKKETGTLHDAKLVVNNGGSNANNARLSLANDPMAPNHVVIDWNQSQSTTPKGSTTYSGLEADTVMQVDVDCATGFKVKVEVTNHTTGDTNEVTRNDPTKPYLFSMPAGDVEVTVTFVSTPDVEYTAKLKVTHSGTDQDLVNNTAKLTNATTGAATDYPTVDSIKGATNTKIKVELTLNSDYDAVITLTPPSGTPPSLYLVSKSDTLQEHYFFIPADTEVGVTFTKAARYEVKLAVSNDVTAPAASVVDANTAKMSADGTTYTTAAKGAGGTNPPTAVVVTEPNFQRESRNIYLSLARNPGYQVKNIEVRKAGTLTVLGDLTQGGTGGTGLVKTTTANQAYTFMMPGEAVDVEVIYGPIQGYKVQLTTNVATFSGSTVEATSNCPAHTATDKLEGTGQAFNVFVGNTVTIAAKPGSGKYVTVTATRTDTNQQLYLSSTVLGGVETYEFQMPLLNTTADMVEVNVQFSNDAPTLYTASIDESTAAGSSASGGNYTRWDVLNHNNPRQVAINTALQANVSVAPGYYISSVRVLGKTGAVPFVLSGNGYNGGGGGSETVNFVMPGEDATLYVVYAEGVPPAEPNYSATLVVAGPDVGANGTYTLASGGMSVTQSGDFLLLPAGASLTGTFRPDTGYYVKSVLVTADSATPISWQMKPDGTLAATMPAANIVVRVEVGKTDGLTPFDLTLEAAGTDAGSLKGAKVDGTSATATTDGTTAGTATLSVYPDELVVLTTTNSAKLSTVAGTGGAGNLNFSLATGTGNVSLVAAGTVTAVWDAAIVSTPVVTFTMTDIHNDGTVTNKAEMKLTSGTLSLTSSSNAGATATGAVAAGETVVVTWTLDSGYTARPLEVTKPDGTMIAPLYLDENTAIFTSPDPAQRLQVVLPVVKAPAADYLTTIVTRMTDGSAIPAGADSYFAGKAYSIAAPAGTSIPFTMEVPNGYYIEKVTVNPASLGVPVTITGQFGTQTGAFVMPPASLSQVNVYLTKGWPDQVKYNLTFHIQNAGDGTVTYQTNPIIDGATYTVVGDSPVSFTALPAAGKKAVVAVLDGEGNLLAVTGPDAAGTYTFAMPFSDAQVSIIFLDDTDSGRTVGLNLLSTGGVTGSATLKVNATVTGPIAVDEFTSQQAAANDNVVVAVTPDVGGYLYLLNKDGVTVTTTPVAGGETYAFTMPAGDSYLTALLAPKQVQPPANGAYTAQLVVNNDLGGANTAALARTSGSDRRDSATAIYSLNLGDQVNVNIAVAPGYKVGTCVVLPAESLLAPGDDPAAAAQSHSFPMPGRDVVVYVEFVVDDAATYAAVLATDWAGAAPPNADYDLYVAGKDYATVQGPQTNPPITARHGQNALGTGDQGDTMVIAVTTYTNSPTTPAKAHYIDHYEVTDQAGNPVAYTITATGLSFVMPASAVQVKVYFSDTLKENNVNLHVSGINGAADYSATVAEPNGAAADAAAGITPSTHTATLAADGDTSILAGVGRPVNVALDKPVAAFIQAVYLMQDGRVLAYTYDPAASPSSFIMPDGDVDLYVAFAPTQPAPGDFAAVLTVEGPTGNLGVAGFATMKNSTAPTATDSDGTADGTVTVQSNGPHAFVNAAAGDILLVTVTVAEGYAIDKVEGSLTTVTPTGDPNEYTFTMPVGSNAGAHVILKADVVTNPVKVNLHVAHRGGGFNPDNAATLSYLAGVTTHALKVEAGATGSDTGTMSNLPPTQTMTLTVEPQPDYFVRAAYAVQKKTELQNGSNLEVYRLVDLSKALEGATAKDSATFTLSGVDVDVFVFYEKGTPPVAPWYNLVVFATDYALNGTTKNTGDSTVKVSSAVVTPATILKSDGILTNFYSLPLGEALTLTPTAATGYKADQIVYTPAGLGGTTLTDGKWELNMLGRNASAQVVFWEDSTPAAGHALTLAVEDLRDPSDTTTANTAALAVGTDIPATLTTNAATGALLPSAVVSTNVANGAILNLKVTPGLPAASAVPYIAVASYTTTNATTPTSVLLTTADSGVTYTGTLAMPSEDTVVKVTFFEGYPLKLGVGHGVGVPLSDQNTATLVYAPTTGPNRSIIGNATTAPVGGGAVLGVEGGKTVTLTVSPTTGYQVEAVEVLDAGGNAIPYAVTGGGALTDAKNGVSATATFTMPMGAASVKVMYANAEERADLTVNMTDRTANSQALTHQATIQPQLDTAATPLTLTTTPNSPASTAMVTLNQVLGGDTVTVAVTPDTTTDPAATFVVKAKLSITVNGVPTTAVLVPTVQGGVYTLTFPMPRQAAQLDLELTAGYIATMKVAELDGATGDTSVLTATPNGGTSVSTPAALEGTPQTLENLLSGEDMTTTTNAVAGQDVRTVVLTTAAGTKHLPAAGSYPSVMPPEDVTFTAVFGVTTDVATDKGYVAAVTRAGGAGEPLNGVTIANTTTAGLKAGLIWAEGRLNDQMKVNFTTAPGIYAQVTAYPVDPATGVENGTAPIAILQLGVTGTGEAWFLMPQDKNVQVYVTFSNTPPNAAALKVEVTGGGNDLLNQATLTAASGTPAPFTVTDGTSQTQNGVPAGESFAMQVSSKTGYVLKSVQLAGNGISVPVTAVWNPTTKSFDGSFLMPASSATLTVTLMEGYRVELALHDTSTVQDNSAGLTESLTGQTAHVQSNNPAVLLDPLPAVGKGSALTVKTTLATDSRTVINGVLLTDIDTGSTTFGTANQADPATYTYPSLDKNLRLTVVTEDATPPYTYLAVVELAGELTVAGNGADIVAVTDATFPNSMPNGDIWTRAYAAQTVKLSVTLAQGYHAYVTALDTQSKPVLLHPLDKNDVAQVGALGITASGNAEFAMPAANVAIRVVYLKGDYTATLMIHDFSTIAGNTASIQYTDIGSLPLQTESVDYSGGVLVGLQKGDEIHALQTPANVNSISMGVVATNNKTGSKLAEVPTTPPSGNVHETVFEMEDADATVSVTFKDAATHLHLAALNVEVFLDNVRLDPTTTPNNTASFLSVARPVVTTFAAGVPDIDLGGIDDGYQKTWIEAAEDDLVTLTFATETAPTPYYVTVTATGATGDVMVLQQGITTSGRASFYMPGGNVQVTARFDNVKPSLGTLAQDLTVSLQGHGKDAGNKVTVTHLDPSDITQLLALILSGDEAVDETTPVTELTAVFPRDTVAIATAPAGGYRVKSVILEVKAPATGKTATYPVALDAVGAGDFLMPTIPTGYTSTLRIIYVKGYTATLTLADGSVAKGDEATMSAPLDGTLKSVTSTMDANNKTIEGLVDRTKVDATPVLKGIDSVLKAVLATQGSTGSTTYLAETVQGSNQYSTPIAGDDLTVTVLTQSAPAVYAIAARSVTAPGTLADADNKMTALTNTTAAAGNRTVQSAPFWSELLAEDEIELTLAVAAGYAAEITTALVDGTAVGDPVTLYHMGSVTITAPAALAQNIQVTVTYKKANALAAYLVLVDKSTIQEHAATLTVTNQTPPLTVDVDSKGDTPNITDKATIQGVYPNDGLSLAVDMKGDATSKIVAVMATTDKTGTVPIPPATTFAAGAAPPTYNYTVGDESPTITLLLDGEDSTTGYAAMVKKEYAAAVTDQVKNTVTAVENQGDNTLTGDGKTWVPVAAGHLVRVDFVTKPGVYVTVTAVETTGGTALAVLHMGNSAYVNVPTPAASVQLTVTFNTATPSPADLTVISTGHAGVVENVTTVANADASITATLTPDGTGTTNLTGTLAAVNPATDLTLTATHHDNYKIKSAVLTATANGSTVTVPLTLDVNNQNIFPMPYSNATLIVTYELGSYGPRPYDPANKDAAATDPAADGYLQAVNNADHLVVTVPVLLGASGGYENVQTPTDADPTVFTLYHSADGGTTKTALVQGTDFTVSPFVDTDTTDYTYGTYYTDNSVPPPVDYTGAKFILRPVLDAADPTKGKTPNAQLLLDVMDNLGTDLSNPAAGMLYLTATNGTGVESEHTQLQVPQYYTFTGTLKSYAPNHETVLTLTEEVTGTAVPAVYAVELRDDGVELWEQTVAFRSSELAGKSYTLTAEKASNLPYTRTGILLDSIVTTNYDSTTLTFTLDGGNSVTLIPGDLDGNGIVATGDRSTMYAAIRSTTFYAFCDLNGDGVVATADLAILNANMGRTVASYGNPTGLTKPTTRVRRSTWSLGELDITPHCTCGAGEESRHHEEDCHFYLPPELFCFCEGADHILDCPLYVEPVPEQIPEPILPMEPELPAVPEEPIDPGFSVPVEPEPLPEPTPDPEPVPLPEEPVPEPTPEPESLPEEEHIPTTLPELEEISDPFPPQEVPPDLTEDDTIPENL